MRSLTARIALAASAAGAIAAAGAPAAASAPTTIRASVSSAGAQANGASGGAHTSDARISGSGRYVAFFSDASNLVPGDTNRSTDVFVHDRKTGRTERVSVSSTGAQANAESFGALAITPDGRYVAFHSLASNLVPNDPDGDFDDVFLRDRVAGTTRRIPDSDFVFDIELSRDARIVAYDSFDGWISVYNRKTGRTTTPNLGDLAIDGAGLGGMSADGRYVLFDGYTPRSGVVVSVLDRRTGRAFVVSRARGGGYPDGDSLPDAISADGLHQMFTSTADNIVRGDTNGKADVFVHSSITGRTRRVSVGTGGRQANGASSGGGLSAHGRVKLFVSAASNLVSGDTDGVRDLFIGIGSHTRRVTVGGRGVQPNHAIIFGSLAEGGAWLAFVSRATNLVPGDTNGFRDVFVRGPIR